MGGTYTQVFVVNIKLRRHVQHNLFIMSASKYNLIKIEIKPMLCPCWGSRGEWVGSREVCRALPCSLIQVAFGLLSLFLFPFHICGK